ncbi:MAG: hypothetical protein IPO92_16765 [Saprospiraceae bacterium]|nr:hypothetical protein [Saprospiraceae bacterium]
MEIAIRINDLQLLFKIFYECFILNVFEPTTYISINKPIEIAIRNDDSYECESPYFLTFDDINHQQFTLSGEKIHLDYDTVDVFVKDDISINRINIKDKFGKFSNYLVNVNGNSYHCLISLFDNALNVHIRNKKSLHHKKSQLTNKIFCVQGIFN